MSLQEALESGKFVVTSEIGPPKGTDILEALEAADVLKGRVDAINVTDLQSAVMRLGSLATCHLLIDRGLEPVFQVTCRDRNRLALQSDLLNASVLGIRNVLALTGDHTSLGDHPDAKPVFDLDAVLLLRTIKRMGEGYDLSDTELTGSPPQFFRGAVVSPVAEPLEPQLIKMEQKIEAGAQFFQTQGVFDLETFEKFMKLAGQFNMPILGGIILLKSAGMARFMNQNIAGVYVPDDLIREMGKGKSKDRARTSVEIAARLIRGMKNLCQGVHLMPLGWEHRVPKILDKAEL